MRHAQAVQLTQKARPNLAADAFDLAAAAWSGTGLSARTAQTITEDSSSGGHWDLQVLSAIALGVATHWVFGIPASSGNGRYVSVHFNNGDHHIYLDTQAGTIQSSSGAGITNLSYSGGILAFDYAPIDAKNLYLACSDGTQNLTYQGNGARTATFTFVSISQG